MHGTSMAVWHRFNDVKGELKQYWDVASGERKRGWMVCLLRDVVASIHTVPIALFPLSFRTKGIRTGTLGSSQDEQILWPVKGGQAAAAAASAARAACGRPRPNHHHFSRFLRTGRTMTSEIRGMVACAALLFTSPVETLSDRRWS
jgi:hypothetical protein